MSAYLGWFASRFGQKSALLWQPGNVCFSDSRSTLAIIKYESQMKTDLKRSRLVRDLKMDYHQSQFCKHCRSTALGSNAFCNSTRRFTPDSVLMSITALGRCDRGRLLDLSLLSFQSLSFRYQKSKSSSMS